MPCFDAPFQVASAWICRLFTYSCSFRLCRKLPSSKPQSGFEHNSGTGQPEADAVVPKARVLAATVRRTHAPGTAVPSAAAYNAVGATGRSCRISLRFAGVASVPVPYGCTYKINLACIYSSCYLLPFPHVPTHVV